MPKKILSMPKGTVPIAARGVILAAFAVFAGAVIGATVGRLGRRLATAVHRDVDAWVSVHPYGASEVGEMRLAETL